MVVDEITKSDEEWGRTLVAAGVTLMVMGLVKDIAAVHFGVEQPELVSIEVFAYMAVGAILYSVLWWVSGVAFLMRGVRTDDEW